MAEKIISPGVFTNEIDQTFLPAAVADIGAALIGPTLKGPAGIPTVVTSFSDFQAKFGDVTKNGATGDSVQFLTSHAAEEYLKNSDTLTVVRILDGTFTPATATITASGGTLATGLSIFGADSGSLPTTVFTLETLADGAIMNNADNTITTNAILLSGSKANIRYEISNTNNKKGTFTLGIRAGNDNEKRKQTLESFTGVNLDPNSNNFITKVIGDQKFTVRTDENSKPFLQLTGSYPNKSRFVRVKSVESTAITTDYLDENGNIRLDTFSGSLPLEGSGSGQGGFLGGANGVSGFDALGNQVGTAASATYNFYESINEAGSQGYVLSTGADGTNAYTQALDLLANQDEFDINLILLPGIIDSIHSTITSKAVDICEDRGDCKTIISIFTNVNSL